MPLSTYTKEALVDAIQAKTGFAGGTLYMSLHSANPGVTGTSELPTSNGYSRQSITFGAGSDTGVYWTVASTNSQVFTNTGSSWSSATYLGIWDASSGGNFISYDALDETKTVVGGAKLTFAIGDVTGDIGLATSPFRISSYLAGKLADAIWRNTSYAGETNYYYGLEKNDTQELSAVWGYARQGPVNLIQYTSLIIRSDTASHVFNATNTWAFAQAFSLYNASSGGNLLFVLPSSTFPLQLVNGDSLTVGNADFRVDFD